ncbi:MAG: radical SAM protein [Firmicutes bacterium]|nr:radical SAM protein [Bacillota bacterium]
MSITWYQLDGHLKRLAIAKRVPIVGQFELTARCNLRCKMCYVVRAKDDKDAMARERTAEEWIRLAEEARDAGMLYLLLTGGEVFLRQDFAKIYEAVARMGFSTTIYTNATLITPAIARWLGGIPPSRIEVTLYGASPETYAKVCGDAEGFRRAVHGLDLLLAEGIGVSLRTTIIDSNVDDFDELARLAQKRGITLQVVNYVSPRREGCGTGPQTERLSPQELARFEMHIRKMGEKKEKKATADNRPLDDCAFEEDRADKIIGDMLSRPVEDAFNCLAGKCAFWMTWDGRMTPCALMNQPETLLFDRAFTEAWKELQTMCAAIPACSACMRCSLKKDCMVCPARLYNETGFYDQPAAYLRELAKERGVIMNNE